MCKALPKRKVSLVEEVTVNNDLVVKETTNSRKHYEVYAFRRLRIALCHGISACEGGSRCLQENWFCILCRPKSMGQMCKTKDYFNLKLLFGELQFESNSSSVGR
jgi:hypothetical protein